MRAEELLDKHAKRHMIQWSLNSFRKTYPRLLRSIVGAIDEALENNKIELNKTVYHKEIYDGKEPMKIVGIRENELELQGDYSGGTHNVCQKSWLPIDGVIFK